MPNGITKDEMRLYRYGTKYTKKGDAWSLDTSKDVGIRPIDLSSREPDVLREFGTKEAAIAFEEKCFQDKWDKKKRGENICEYMTIPSKKLQICEEHEALQSNFVSKMRDNRDHQDEQNEAG